MLRYDRALFTLALSADAPPALRSYDDGEYELVTLPDATVRFEAAAA
jgi:hypothetical protein